MTNGPILSGIKKRVFRVLVFPSCNEPGLEAIAALAKSNKVQLYGGSSGDTEFDPSRQLLKHHLVLPSLDETDFKRKFLAIARLHGIRIVFPTVDALVAEFASWRELDITFVVPPAETAALVFSKRKVYEMLAPYVRVPKMYPRERIFPSYAKPEYGSGNKGACIVTNMRELTLARLRKLLITEYLPGTEYTVDALNDLSGHLLTATVRVRGKIGRSISLGTKLVQKTGIPEMMETISSHLTITGPWFAQFKEDTNGEPTLLEINCRIGGSSGLTRLSGINIPLLSLFLYAGYPISIPNPRSSVVLNRHLTNLCDMPRSIREVFWDLNDTIIRKDGKPDPDCMSALYDFRNRGYRQYLLTRESTAVNILRQHAIDRDLFIRIISCTDKTDRIRRVMKKSRIPAVRIAVINDSMTENLYLQAQIPGITTITPDALAIIGKDLIT